MKKITAYLLLFLSINGISQEKTDDQYFEIAKNMSIFNDVYKNINLFFVDETAPGELMKTGIDAMLKSLDPYTNYIPESNIEDYRMMQTGQYGGIGSLIKQQGEYIVISDPYDNFPAQKAGLKAGDKILEVNGKSVVGKKTSEVSEILKGTAGTELVLSIKRQNSETPIEKKIIREVIKVPSVPYFDMVDEQTAYIKLTSFTQTASKEIKDAYTNLKDSNSFTQLILDLRGNGGGLLHEAVNIVNFFTPQGTKVVETKGRLKEHSSVYRAKKKPLDTKLPVIVLIDEGSASASEIVSGSLQDLDRAVVIGRQSYGKGLVQQTKNLEYNTMVKITIAKYYTPSGRCIQRLDYSNRSKSGKGSNISDSLLTEFKTTNGRVVKDGRGIDPDIEIEEMNYSSLTQKLVIEDVIFDFATNYYYTHDTIVSADKFRISESDYELFKEFALAKDLEYETYSEKALEVLKETAEKEKYFEDAKAEYEILLKKLTPNKERDLVKFENEIKEFLVDEIVSRYYYQKGRTKASLSKDPYILKAIETLNNTNEYNKILKP
jgi:carboxyl-terminal processing protease